jgi:hypothetical protein
MASRRLLLSVADGTARAFANRGNDVDGWWALGLLLAATKPTDPDYRLDLLTGETTPPTITPALDQLGPAWARYFAWTLVRHGVPAARVRNAELTVRYNRGDAVTSWIPGNSDRPFACTVSIRDDQGRGYERTIAGHCSRLSDFTNPDPEMRPRRSGGPSDAGRIVGRISAAPSVDLSGPIPPASDMPGR